jgi:hypothetical protein
MLNSFRTKQRFQAERHPTVTTARLRAKSPNGGSLMKANRVSIILIIVNLVLLGLQFARGSPDRPDPVAPIVRAHEIQLVDEQGRERAQLKVWPAQPNVKMPDGSIGMPEVVELYVMTSKGGRNIKFGASEDGAGLILGGDKGWIQLLSRGVEDPFVKIHLNDGREKTFKVD